MTIEDELNSLPYFLTKYDVEIYCNQCRRTHKQNLHYKLKLKLEPYVSGLKYHLYYYCTDYYCDERHKYIGEHTGFGFKTIHEAIEDLKRYLEE